MGPPHSERQVLYRRVDIIFRDSVLTSLMTVAGSGGSKGEGEKLPSPIGGLRKTEAEDPTMITIHQKCRFCGLCWNKTIQLFLFQINKFKRTSIAKLCTTCITLSISLSTKLSNTEKNAQPQINFKRKNSTLRCFDGKEIYSLFTGIDGRHICYANRTIAPMKEETNLRLKYSNLLCYCHTINTTTAYSIHIQAKCQ
jgi:hypothetical protein